VRTRPTVCEILTNRGYNAEGYKGVSSAELESLASNKLALTIVANKVEGSIAPKERAVVMYMVETPIRLSLDKQINELFSESQGVPISVETTEVIVLHNEPEHDAFTTQAQRQWAARRAYISFFPIKVLISNPARHVMVPPHRRLTEEEVKETMVRHSLKSKSELPHIKYHLDMQARILGLVPGDIVEIKRSSETAGITITFRVCVS
jgi:DNA-directed RNA polymerase subunit H (RpoH/RPB5)